jgi:chromodomain-helicase-DNA-binding protein 4
MTDAAFINRCSWTCVVADEAHRLKNRKTKVFETMTSLTCKRRVALTGTPLQNNFEELWSVFPLHLALKHHCFSSIRPGA